MGGSGGIRRVLVALLAGIAMFVWAAAAEAVVPGQNGKILFGRFGQMGAPSTIWTVNPDGSGQTQIAEGHGARFSPDGTKIAFFGFPPGDQRQWLRVMNADGSGATSVYQCASCRDTAWSPDQTRIAFDTVGFAGDPQETFTTIEVVNVDGTGHQVIASAVAGPTTSDDVQAPSWSPRGNRIAFARTRNIWTVRPDGTEPTQITNSGLDSLPEWSPDGTRILFASQRDGGLEIYSMNSDGSNVTRLTFEHSDTSPMPSPDGAKVVFQSGRSPAGIYTMSAAGTNITPVAAAPYGTPDWQPTPYTGYARPKGATPLRVPLVIAYRNCAAPTEQHGPPLAFPSCSPPVEQSDWVTTGTADSNGQATQFVGSLRLDTVPGNPSTPADEANVKVEMNITDVRRKDNMLDYVGDIQATIVVRITDRFNSVAAGGGTDPATMLDIPFPFGGTCAATADPAVGSTCGAVTSIDAIVPNAIREGQRAIWQTGQVEVVDGGPDGSIGTTPNTVFARQGIFVP